MAACTQKIRAVAIAPFLCRLFQRSSLQSQRNILPNVRYLATAQELKYDHIKVEVTENPLPKPDQNTLMFGKQFTDHMLEIEWDAETGWGSPQISPFRNLSLPPAASALHYAVECFEGMKAYRGDDGKVRLFRPMENMRRLNNSAARVSLPTFDEEEFLQCLKHLVSLDKEWVPYSNKCSLYIRPTFIGTEPSLGVSKSSKALLFVILSPVGPYFKTGSFNPVALLADPALVRAWPGGSGDNKLGGNYGPTILPQATAERQGLHQVLWLFGEDHQVTEVGTMNFFMFWINENGEEELITPPLSGVILPGITRKSLLELARQWGEFKVSERNFTMRDIVKAVEEERVKEIFGAGTACVVCPVNRISYLGKDYIIPTMENGAKITKRFYEELTGIQYGKIPSQWTVEID